MRDSKLMKCCGSNDGLPLTGFSGKKTAPFVYWSIHDSANFGDLYF